MCESVQKVSRRTMKTKFTPRGTERLMTRLLPGLSASLALSLLLSMLLLPAGSVAASETKSAVSGTELAQQPNLLPLDFAELLDAGNLSWNNEKVQVLKAEDTSGIVISGKNRERAQTRFVLSETFDFGNAVIDRIRVDGLGVRGRETMLDIYLDGAEEPAASLTLPAQSVEGSWEDCGNINADVSALQLTGEHTVEFCVCQYANGSPRKMGSAEVLLQSIQFVAASIPVVEIEIDESLGTIEAMNSDEKHTVKCYGDMTIRVPDSYENRYDENTDDVSDGDDSDGDVGNASETDASESYEGGTYEMEYIRGRGNSTWSTDGKHPYKIKLAERADLFNMGSSKHWALIANEYDDSLLRNQFTYLLGEETGLAWPTETVSVDVLMNGEYLGNYQLCETIRVDESSVDIDAIEEADQSDPELVTGGYLLGTGSAGADEGDYTFTTEHGMEFTVSSPESGEDADYSAANQYITDYIQRLEYAIYGERNPDTGEVEDPFDLMDLESAAAYYCIQEFSDNGDFLETASTYCYKVRNGKLYWGPLWDFDIAYQTGFAYGEDGTYEGAWNGQKIWFKQLLSNETFLQAVEDYWRGELYPAIQALTAEGGLYDTLADQNAYSTVNNFGICGYGKSLFDAFSYVGPGQDPTELLAYYKTNTDGLKKLIIDRAAWFDENLDTIQPTAVKVVFKVDGQVYQTIDSFDDEILTAIPEGPVSADENQVFTGWYQSVQYGDSDPTLRRVTNTLYVDTDNATWDETAQSYVLEVNARFKDEADVIYCENLYPLRSTCQLYLLQDAPEITCVFEIPQPLYQL